MSFLRAHHCDEIQGYYFSKPLAVDEVAGKLRATFLKGPSGHKQAETIVSGLTVQSPIEIRIKS